VTVPSSDAGGPKLRSRGLDTHDSHALNQACIQLYKAFGGHPYLVGTAAESADYRDVDVRQILDDDTFDRLFAGREKLWGLICFAIGHWLRDVTGLPIDFQIQRQTEANARHSGIRSALGMNQSNYAGGGDATRFGGSDV
jgi:hypothetical protein